MIIKIESISTNQLNQVIDIWLEANIEAHPFVSEDYWKSNQVEVRKLLPQSDVYVYQLDNTIIGFMGIVDGYIAGIFVKNTYRGQKIGQKLLNTAKDDYSELTLAVYKKNQLAYHFYLREDFEVQEVSMDEENQEVEYLMNWKK